MQTKLNDRNREFIKNNFGKTLYSLFCNKLQIPLTELPNLWTKPIVISNRFACLLSSLNAAKTDLS